MGPNATRFLAVTASCVAVLLLPTGHAARADDDGPSLVTRIYDLRALTDGRPDFLSEENFSASRHREFRPLFGAEMEEPRYPVGSIDEIIELLKNFVHPRTWEEVEGADMAAVYESHIIARAPAATLDALGRYLAELEGETMTTVTVDMHTVRLPTDRAAALRAKASTHVADDVAAKLIAGANAGPAATLTTFAGSRAAVYTGAQISYVEDFDVEVAKGSTISDPIVDVANAGLAIDVTPLVVSGTGHVRVVLHGGLAHIARKRAGACGEGRNIDLPDANIITLGADVSLPDGTWHLIDGAASRGADAHWHLLVRATTNRHQFAPAPAQNWDYDRTVRNEPFEVRHMRISDLNYAPVPHSGSNMHLLPSNFTPPEPPELREPYPIFPQEVAPELVMTLGGSVLWEDPAAIEARNGRLIARNRPSVLDGVENMLGQLRRALLWSIVCTTEVIEVPVDLPLGDRFLLDDEARAAIEDALREGNAKRVDSVRVASFAGARNTVRSGERFNYLQDYEVEIAERSAISNPVVQHCLEGMQVDVDPALLSGGKSAHVALQLTRTRRPGPMPTSTTPVGTIDLPELDVLRVRTNLVVPIGATAVVGAGTHEGRRRVVLLTPQLERYEK